MGRDAGAADRPVGLRRAVHHARGDLPAPNWPPCIPHAGGQYVFLREAYGDFWAFLFGWTQFLVIQTGFNAAVAIAFAKYLGVLVPSLGEANVLARIPLGELLPLAAQAHVPHCLLHFELNSAQLVACGVIALLTGVNIRGVREGAFVQNLFTVLKVAALVALIVAGLSRCGGGAAFLPTDRAHARQAGASRRAFWPGWPSPSRRPCSPTTPGTRSPSWPRRSTTPIARCPGRCCWAACW